MIFSYICVIEKTDLRYENAEVRLAFRKRSITLLKGGKKKKEIAIILGVSVNTITEWCKKYTAGSLKEKKKGVSSEDSKYLILFPPLEENDPKRSFGSGEVLFGKITLD